MRSILTLDTWAEKFESFERINSIRETNGNFDSCNSCKRLVLSRLHELHESKFPFVSRIEFIRSKLSNFSAHVSGVIGACRRSRHRAANSQRLRPGLSNFVWEQSPEIVSAWRVFAKAGPLIPKVIFDPTTAEMPFTQWHWKYWQHIFKVNSWFGSFVWRRFLYQDGRTAGCVSFPSARGHVCYRHALHCVPLTLLTQGAHGPDVCVLRWRVSPHCCRGGSVREGSVIPARPDPWHTPHMAHLLSSAIVCIIVHTLPSLHMERPCLSFLSLSFLSFTPVSLSSLYLSFCLPLSFLHTALSVICLLFWSLSLPPSPPPLPSPLALALTYRRYAHLTAAAAAAEVTGSVWGGPWSVRYPMSIANYRPHYYPRLGQVTAGEECRSERERQGRRNYSIDLMFIVRNVIAAQCYWTLTDPSEVLGGATG